MFTVSEIFWHVAYFVWVAVIVFFMIGMVLRAWWHTRKHKER